MNDAKPVVKFRTRPDHYEAAACVVWCFDDRFYKLLKKFGKKRGLKDIDLVKVVDGAKALAVPLAEPSPERDFLLAQLKTSVRLHGTKKIILMLHRDCSGYGGSKAFPDASEERTRLMADTPRRASS